MRSLISVSILTIITLQTIRSQTDTVFNQVDSKGLKQGFWKKNYPNGKLMYSGSFKDGKPVGEMRRYYNTGDLQALMKFDKTGEYAYAVLYYDTGDIAAKGKYHKEKKDSLWTYYSYYTGAITTTENYTDGVKNGLEEHYYPNGQVSDEILWVNDKKEGPWHQYFDDGTIKLNANYTNNMVNGGYKLYYPGGNPYILGQYIDNMRNGKWTFFDDNGKVKYVLNYKYGKAENEEALIRQDSAFFKKVDENMGKFQEPSLEDFIRKDGGSGY